MATTIRGTGVLFNNNTTQRKAFPVGGIILWFGNLASIPDGWVLCDGTNGTPDLRDKMVIGAGGLYPVSVQGGTSTVTLVEANLPTHTHTLTGTLSAAGSHSHTVTVNTDGDHNHTYSPSSVIGPGGPNPFGPGPARVGAADVSPAGNHSHSAPNTGADGLHSHPITASIAPVGSGEPHENLPPYYALAFLQSVVV